MICNFFGCNLSDISEENIKKLKQRYAKGFAFKNARRDGKKIDWNELESEIKQEGIKIKIAHDNMDYTL